MHSVRPTRTRVTAALASLALGSVLTACGSDEPEAGTLPTSAATSSTAEATETTDAPSEEPSEVDGGSDVAVGEFAERLTAGIEKTKQAHLEFTMSGAGGEMAGSGDVDYTSDPPEMQLTMEIGPESLAMLLVRGKMYVKSSQTGDKYLSFDLSDPTNPLGAGFSEQLDPAGSMKSFVTALASVTRAGEEDVDGRSLERFELVVDTTKLSGQAGAGQLPAEMKVTVWLDDQDRMARSVMDMGALKYDASMSDFDKALDLKPPPDDQVAQQPTG